MSDGTQPPRSPADLSVQRTVLVTGVSRYLPGRVALALRDDPRVGRLIGVDVTPPKAELPGVEFVRADIRNPIIAKILAQAEVDTVVHMAVVSTPQSAGGRSTMKEINVIGTMQLLAACQKAESVGTFVLKSSATVYGSSPKDPAMFTEEMEPRQMPRSGYAKDCVEVEGYVRGFARRRPDVLVTILRLANVLGPRISTPLSSYLSLPAVPTPLGFDPRLQFVHEDDATEVLRRATVEDHEGTFNVAGSGVLFLSQLLRRAGRLEVPLPSRATGLLGQIFRSAGIADFSPEQMAFLSFGRGLDCSRLAEAMGSVVRHSTAETFDAFAASHPAPAPITPDLVAGVERNARELVRALASASA